MPRAAPLVVALVVAACACAIVVQAGGRRGGGGGAAFIALAPSVALPSPWLASVPVSYTAAPFISNKGSSSIAYDSYLQKGQNIGSLLGGVIGAVGGVGGTSGGTPRPPGGGPGPGPGPAPPPGGSTSRPPVEPRPGVCPRGVGVREEVSSLASDSPTLNTLRLCISRMRELDNANPAGNQPPRSSARAQTEIHPDSCSHQNWWFLPFHRAYMFQWEDICRQLTGDEEFMLPYWDWTLDEGRIPAVFLDRNEAELFDARRSVEAARGDPVTFDTGGGGRSNAEVVRELQENTATLTAYLGDAGAPGNQQDRVRAAALETGPHNAIHQFVGGVAPAQLDDGTAAPGDMTVFRTAGDDPLFWMHHCNIDRLWALWQDTHADVPAPTSWLDEPLLGIWDRNGDEARVSSRRFYRTQDWCYRYPDQNEAAIPWPVEVDAAQAEQLVRDINQDVQMQAVQLSPEFGGAGGANFIANGGGGVRAEAFDLTIPDVSHQVSSSSESLVFGSGLPESRLLAKIDLRLAFGDTAFVFLAAPARFGTQASANNNNNGHGNSAGNGGNRGKDNGGSNKEKKNNGNGHYPLFEQFGAPPGSIVARVSRAFVDDGSDQSFGVTLDVTNQFRRAQADQPQGPPAQPRQSNGRPEFIPNSRFIPETTPPPCREGDERCGNRPHVPPPSPTPTPVVPPRNDCPHGDCRNPPTPTPTGGNGNGRRLLQAGGGFGSPYQQQQQQMYGGNGARFGNGNINGYGALETQQQQQQQQPKYRLLVAYVHQNGTRSGARPVSSSSSSSLRNGNGGNRQQAQQLPDAVQSISFQWSAL